MEEEVKFAALRQMEELATRASRFTGPEQASREYQSLMAALALTQVALTLPAASVGKCAHDGTDLQFEGRSSGLFVCCGGSPQHCWQIK